VLIQLRVFVEVSESDCEEAISKIVADALNDVACVESCRIEPTGQQVPQLAPEVDC